MKNIALVVAIIVISATSSSGQSSNTPAPNSDGCGSINEVIQEIRGLRMDMRDLLLKQIRANFLLNKKLQLINEIDEISLRIKQAEESVKNNKNTITDNRNSIDELETSSKSVNTDVTRSANAELIASAEKIIVEREKNLRDLEEKSRLLDQKLTEAQKEYKTVMTELESLLPSIGITVEKQETTYIPELN